jgi:hypothetical protein
VEEKWVAIIKWRHDHPSPRFSLNLWPSTNI